MPELPEVETTLRGLKPHLENQTVRDVILRCDKLRWPISKNLKAILHKKSIQSFSRRGKYLLFHFKHGTLIIHLGMSGKLQIFTAAPAVKKHDHVDIIFADKKLLRYTDPRRFGAILWTQNPPHQHPLLCHLGVEPLEKNFTAKYLFDYTQKRNLAIKLLIMNANIVVGVGNIYATEALFMAGIHPATPAKLLTLQHCQTLVRTIKKILKQAIQQGGTTLKDFMNSDGKPGYFSQELQVYGRQSQPCFVCETIVQSMQLGKRSSAFCPTCQS